MSSIVMWVAAVIAVSVAVTKLVRARRQLTAGTVYLCGALGSIGGSAGLAAPATLVAATAIEPFPDATRVAANVMALTAAFCVYGILAHLVFAAATVRGKIRRQAIVLGVASMALAVFRVLAPMPENPQFMGAFADEPAAVAYVVVFAGHIAANAAAFVWLIYRYLRYIDRTWLRAGMMLIQAGAATAVLWGAFKITAALTMWLTGHPLGVASSVSSLLPALCITLVAIGTALPTAGPLASLPLRWARQYRRYRRLAPLWQLLAEVAPEIANTDTAPAKADMPTRLTRRVVEIRDGLLFIAPYGDSTVAAAAENAATSSGITGTDRDALVTAAHVIAAARARQCGQPPLQEAPEPPQQRPDTFRGEVAWLAAIADHCHHPTALAAAQTTSKDHRDAHT